MDLEALEQMLSQGQDNAMLRFTLGNLYLKADQLEAAILHLSEALKQNSRHSASWKALGKALAQAGRDSEAITTYRQGIQVAEELGDLQAAREMQVFLNRLLQQAG